MRFIAFSDFHGNKYMYKNAKTTVDEVIKSKDLDFIVICGDLTTRGSPSAAESLLRLADFSVETFFVFGNMDFFDRLNQNFENATNLHLNPVIINDCDLLGIGGDRNDIKYEITSARDIINGLNSEILILISHVAPYMYCDMAYNDRHIGKELNM